MKQNFTLLFLFLITSFVASAQGSESFANSNTSPLINNYLTITWTGDNGRAWVATNARNDEGAPGGTAVTGLTGDYIVVRNTGGNITCTGIPNGCGTISFDYAKAFTAATNPSFGLFVNNVQYGATITVSSNAAANFIIPVNVSGSFTLEIRQLTASTNGRLAIDNIVYTSFNSTPCVEPAAQPTNLIFTATSNAVSGTFDLVPPVTTIQNYLIVRSLSSTLNALPVDGVSYTTGAIVNGGNAVAVGVSDDGSFVDNAVSPNIQYYYFVFSMEDQNCGGAPNYLQANPLTNSVTTPPIPACSAPLAAPTGISLNGTNTTISGSFTLSPSANSYLTIISTSNTISAAPVNGTAYLAGASFGGGTVVSFQSSNSFVATGLSPATAYYLFIFAANNQCTGEPFYFATALEGTRMTTNTTTGIPNGYYDAAEGLLCQPLKTALKNIISTGANTLSYNPGIWNLYQFSDLRRNDANTADIIWDMYSDNPTGPEPYTFTYGVNQDGGQTATAEGQYYNREHSTPQSFFLNASPMVSDAHHIFPTDKVVNALRNNFPYGEVVTATTTTLNFSKLGTGTNFGYSGTIFEPIDAYKGDVARAGLYMATRYEDQIISSNWSVNGSANALFLSPTDDTDPASRRLKIYDEWQLRTLLKWHLEDPVSQKEIDRNNVIYYQAVTVSTGNTLAQNNRNPYVDRPEYVAFVYQCTGLLPVTITSFEGQRVDDFVLLRWFATQETSFKQYEVERSEDGISFSKIGIVAGRNLNNYNFRDYSFQSSKTFYYRLKMIDIDGGFKYSKIVIVRTNDLPDVLTIFPNPTPGAVKINFAQPIAGSGKVQVYDITGRLMVQKNVNAGSTFLELNLNAFANGKYNVRIITNTQVVNQSILLMK